MGRDRAATADDRRRFIEQARTVAAMEIWIRNGGPPPAPARDVAVERGGRRGALRRSAIDAQIDAMVGYDEKGNLVSPARDGAAGRERGPITRVPEHYQPSTLYEWTFYPEHNAREESDSSLYRAARKKLVADGTCLVCGVGKSTLGDPAKNPFKAKQMETHHRLIEWALSEAIDLDRFNTRFVARRRALEPSNAKYAKDFDQAGMLAWIDHDPDNLWVLCDVHHRAPFMGIHAITRPHWDPQDLVFPKFWNRTPPEAEDPRKKKPKPKPKPTP
jgi:hypothetical protein